MTKRDNTRSNNVIPKTNYTYERFGLISSEYSMLSTFFWYKLYKYSIDIAILGINFLFIANNAIIVIRDNAQVNNMMSYFVLAKFSQSIFKVHKL